ncbi:MAG: aminoacyl-tRNA hydrolase [Candidatus Komeilibacteria bacterium]
MYLIIGLGNPGKQYAATRHNFGFLVVDRLAERLAASWENNAKLASRLAFAEHGGRKLILCQPQTFMNESGLAAKAVAKFYKVPAKNIIAVYDDLALDLGRLKIAVNFSSGGHNGIKSLIQHLGSPDFIRLRLGIGPQKGLAEKFVLERFTATENKQLDDILDQAADCLTTLILEGLAKTASKFN